MFYNARYDDPALETFISPDSMVPNPGQVINYNRFLYARGNPFKYTDPTGHEGYDPVGEAWVRDFKAIHHVYPTAQDRIDRIVSFRLPGLATKSAFWDDEDWEQYWNLSHEEKLHAYILADPFDWLVRTMRSNAKDARAREIAELNAPKQIQYLPPPEVPYIDTNGRLPVYSKWADLVAAEKEFDYKGDICAAWDDAAWKFYEGKGYRYDIGGNINYGYVGRSAGFSKIELHAGAAYAQFTDGYWSWRSLNTLGDDPIDQKAIALGIELYNGYGLNIDRAVLVEAFAQEEWRILSIPEK